MRHKEDQHDEVQHGHGTRPPAAFVCRCLVAPADECIRRRVRRAPGGGLALELPLHIEPLALLGREVGGARVALEVFDDHRDKQRKHTYGADQVVHEEEDGIVLRCIRPGLEIAADDAHGLAHHIDPALERHDLEQDQQCTLEVVERVHAAFRGIRPCTWR